MDGAGWRWVELGARFSNAQIFTSSDVKTILIYDNLYKRGKPLIKTCKPRAMLNKKDFMLLLQKSNAEIINWTGNRTL